MKSISKLLVVLACLPLSSAFASGTCSIRELTEIKSSDKSAWTRRTSFDSKESTVQVRDLEDCSATGRALLGKQEVRPFTFKGRARVGKGRRSSRDHYDANCTFTVTKVVMHYLDDAEGSRSVKIKYKYE